MDKFQGLSEERLLFDFAARLGSLEGYLYGEEKVDPSYLPNWLQNIEREFHCLSPRVQREIRADCAELLGKVQDLLRRLYGDHDSNTARIAAILSTVANRGDNGD